MRADDPPGAGRPARLAASARADRTYVAFRWVRHGWADPPREEVTPLGTVRAASLAEAKAGARAAWPGERPAELRVRRASACRRAVLLEALAADGARLVGRTRP